MFVIPNFISDAFKDSIGLILPLFIIFVGIEIFESFFTQKISNLLNFSKKWGPLIGACVAVIPQCGFSVIATALYIEGFLSTGTLIAIYIATSDEAIPILISQPGMFIPMVKIITIKFFIAIIAGYICDLIFKTKFEIKKESPKIKEEGCCHHHLTADEGKNLILHPIKHTFNIFCFIFIICVLFNYLIAKFGVNNIENITLAGSYLQPILAAIVGLIPNCAISVLITMMYIKGILSFASAIAGLCAGGGLGVLLLFKRNSNIKKSLLIVAILFVVSASAGLLLQVCKLIN